MKKTPNAERPTPNIEFRSYRVAENTDGKYASKSKPAYDLEDRLLEFAANIIELTESLPNTRAGNHLAGQVLRCGTSSLSNHGEVEAESRRDFLHKLRICLKDLQETNRWLRLRGRSTKITQPANFTICLNEVDELIRIFVTSVRTAGKKRQMNARISDFGVGRSALDVRRLLL